MQLRGQHGYAMAALLVGMGVAAVLMTAVMPAWKQAARREKEAELIFRGQQYARAIGLFQRRAGPGVLPPNVDVLVSQRLLRKKYKDPITGDDFDLLTPTQGIAAMGAATPGGPGGSGRAGAPPPQGSLASPQAAGGRGGAGAAGGVIGVASKSKAESLRIFNGRTRYNEWQFMFVQQVQAPGAGAPGRGGPPQRGGVPPGGAGAPAGGRQGGPARGAPPPFSTGGRGGFASPPPQR